MWVTSLAALLSHWRRRPLQLAMLLMGLSLATALWTGVQAINAEARASYDRAAASLGGDRLSRLVSPDGALISQSAFVTLRRAGWLVSPVLEGETQFGETRVRVIGIDPLTLPREARQTDVATGPELAAFVLPPGLMIVSAQLARALESEATPPLRIGEGVPPGAAIVDMGLAQALLQTPDGLSYLIVAAGQSKGLPAIGTIAPGLVLEAPDAQGDIARLTDSFHLNLTAFGFLAFAVGLFIVYSAIGLAFEQRRPMFRTLRALGLSARALTGLLLLELVFLAFVAGAAGVTMGYFVASALLPDVASTLRGLYGADVPGALSLRPAWWASGVGIALAGMLVSAAESLWRVSRLPLLASAQPRAWVRASQSALRWQAGAAAGMLALAYAVLELGSGLFAGFAILGALLLGSALALPVVLAILLGLAQKPAHGPLATWFWADTRQQLPGLSLALMALMLALATNIGVGTMVSSFRTTLTGWLDQRLASELYVAARTEEESVALHAWLTPRVDAVLPVWSADDQIADQPAEVFGASDHATYRDNWPLLTSVPDVWNRLARGEAVIINEQLSRRENLGPGDSITLSRGWRATVAGVYSDYGNPVAQVIVGLDEWNQLYPDAPRLRYGVRIAPDKVQAIARELTADFGLPSGNIVDQASLKTLSLDVFERTFSVTAALNVLTLGVAGLAMFASLMTLSGMRLPQLAPVWAAGVTRRRLALLELARTMMLAALTLIAALPVGIGLAWVLLAVVNVEAFGWRLPMHLFPADWAQLGVLGFLAALLAALIPVRRLARLAPSDLLRVFANER